MPLMRLCVRNRLPELLLFLLAVLVLGIGLGWREPWPADEPRFVLVAKQMWESGQWLFPMRGNEFYPDKPPMYFWLLDGAYALTGSWRHAFLLPSLVAGLVTLGLLHDLARRLAGLRAARLATVVLLFTIQFTFQVKRAQIDPVLLAMMTAAFYGLLRHLLWGPAWRWACFGAAMAGLATITKGVGPLALLMLPAFAIAQRIAPRRLAPLRWSNPRWLWLLPAFLLPIAGWLLPMLLSIGDDPARAAYAREILLGQTAGRYLQASGHLKPFWYFGQVALVQWLPLTLGLPWLLPAWRRRLSRGDGRLALLLLTIGLLLLFFSLSSGKREVYILPALPLFVLAATPLLPALWRRRGPQWLVFGVVATLAVLITAASLLALYGQPAFAVKLRARFDFDPFLLTLPLGIGMLVAALACVRWRPAAVWPAALTWAWILLAWRLYPLIDDQSSARGLMRAAGERIGADAQLGLLSWKEQNLLQVDRPVQVFGFLRSRAAQELEARAWLEADPAKRWLLLQPVNLDACFEADKAISVGTSNRRDWLLVNASALRPTCLPHPAEALKDRRVADF